MSLKIAARHGWCGNSGSSQGRPNDGPDVPVQPVKRKRALKHARNADENHEDPL